MNDNIAKNIVNELAKLNTKLDRMNTNHVDIGRLFKTWLETEPVFEELVTPDREAFVIDRVVRCTDITSVHYKHVGTIDRFGESYVLVKFLHTGDNHPALKADQLEILPQPKLNVGDKVRVIDPHSIVYKEVGTITEYRGTPQPVEVEFRDGMSAGEFERKHLELVTKSEEGEKLLPKEWRNRFGIHSLPSSWIGANRENELMTEATFMSYGAGLVEQN